MAGKVTQQFCLYRGVVLVCFIGSGLTSLVLEVVWTRILGTLFGNTVLATSTVLTAFMLGLALGSITLGRLADRFSRPLFLYGLLEIGVGICALLFPWISSVGSNFYVWFYRAYSPDYWTLNAVRLGLSLVFLLPPTLLMGGTLPVLTRYLGEGQNEPGREVGYLYSANTLGGVAGCVLAGFVLLEVLGVTGTLLTAASIAISLGSLAATLGARTSAQPIASVKPPAELPRKRAAPAHGHNAIRAGPLSSADLRLVVAAFAVTGFCALACEVLWTRILLFLLGTTVYAFTVMLSTFLAGTALGAFVCTRWLLPRLKRPLAWFGFFELMIGLSTLGSIYLLARLGSIDLRWAQWFNWGGGQWGLLGVFFADTAVVLFVPTLLMGMAFPLVTTALLHSEAALGRRLGQAFGANTTGCVLGSLAAGFLLIPLLGTRGGLLVVVVLNVAIGVAIMWRSTPPGSLIRWGLVLPCTLAVGAAVIYTPSDVFWRAINTYHAPSTVSFLREHSTGTVTVHDLPNRNRLVAVDGVDVAGTDYMLRTTQKLQGYIPLCLHPKPQRVVQIGFGSGETARVGMEFGVPAYTVVEICPPVFETGRLFSEINHGSYQDSGIRRVIMDAKNFVLLSGEKFDIIMNDSIFPGSSGSSALYTYDHFLHCRDRLAPGGLFSCWVPLDLRANALRMILKSFQAVFPHTSFWVASNCVNKHGLILGTLEPLQIDFARLQELLTRPAIQQDLATIGILDTYDFLDCFVCDEATIHRLTEGAPLNTDDRPLLEFDCARRLPSKLRLLQSLAMLSDFHSPVGPYVVNLPQPEVNRGEMARRFAASSHILRALVGQLAGQARLRRQELDLALRCIPEHPHVRSCEAELDLEIRDLRTVLEKYPGNLELSERLAEKLYLAMRDAEAAAICESLITSGAGVSQTVFTQLAQIQFSTGAVATAEKTLLRCLAHCPNCAEAYDLLAGICLKTGRTADARRYIQQALRLQPRNPAYQEHAAKILAAK